MHVIDPRSNLLSRLLWGLLLGLLQRHPAQAQIAPTWSGQVVDAQSGQPIAHATVQCGAPCAEPSVRTDAQGHFTLNTSGHPPRLSVRACGYSRLNDTLASVSPNSLALQPIRPKALYLSVFGIGSRPLRESALKLAAATEINALVIDVKDDRGLVPHRSASVAASGLGPQKTITVADMPALVRQLKAQNLYLIARVVVFKDNQWASAHTQWAVHRADGSLWRDGEDVAWIDPFQQGAWDRSLALAEEAAQMGFDEIQFDYIRFPDATGLVFSEPATESRRVATINAFLAAARQRLARYNVLIAADIFGYVAWNTNDTQIGQQLEAIAPHVDYLSPMLYPSGFTFGIPEHRNPVAEPYAIVEHTLKRAKQRAAGTHVCWRPWLQAFRDYGFDKRPFGALEIRAQIDAAEATDTQGWMLWNPRNHYDESGLKPKTSVNSRP
mgnify:CR=1 FL=1